MNRRRKLLWGAAGIALALTLFTLADGRGFRRYAKLRAEIEQLTSRNARLAAENDALLREVQAMRGSRWAQERAAREELGFVKPGEIILNLE